MGGGDLLFQQWFELGGSRKAALKHAVKTDPESLLKLLIKGRNRTDFGHQVIPELGYSLYAWNGGQDDEDAVGINFTCGCYFPQIANHCLIQLPAGEDSRARVMQIPALITILTCLVTTWEADWGVVNSSVYNQIAHRKGHGTPRVGWITYLSAARGAIPSLPAPARVVPIGIQGSIIILTEERFTVSNPAHVELAGQVATSLDQAGLLEPMK